MTAAPRNPTPRRRRRGLTLDWRSCYLPLHDHDAHFGNAKAGVFGVVDGVGQYAESGVDAGAFSRGLMTSAAAEVAQSEPGARVCPYALLERAYNQTAASGAAGASTAVILCCSAWGSLSASSITLSGQSFQKVKANII